MEVTFVKAWTYRTPQTTIDYRPGPATVTAEIAKYARAERVLADGEEAEGGAAEPGVEPPKRAKKGKPSGEAE